MKISKPVRVSRTYTQKYDAPVSRVFPLMCPVRESDWIEDWDPLLVVTDSGLVESDCVFITEAEPHNSIWYVTRHEPENYLVEMIKITPGATAVRLNIQFRELKYNCEADVTYTHTSLGAEGDRVVAEFTEEYYSEFMQEWVEMVHTYLAKNSGE